MVICLTNLASGIHELRESTRTRVLNFIQIIKQCFQENVMFRLWIL